MRSAEFLREPDEKPSRPSNVAEPIHVSILDNFAFEPRTAIAEPFERPVNVVHGEHDAEVAEGVNRGIAVIRDDRRREEAGQFEPAVAVRRPHHGNLDALIAQSSDTSGPFSFDRGPPFELKAELAKETNRLFEVIDDDSYVVHPFERHVFSLQGVVQVVNSLGCLPAEQV
ncbi:hypothetical protein Mesci_4078 [Mesorhizobium ciceri biovar biserrulae WSM1271]|uniref:Uncharacterized protein n=1 Tax=Mesorhizobium ciceri biovar biserrulae (strain HAMBI 2942 / LMG 23838 / WSM1271) TaxID=765698 RepID=E8TBZ8_MESCW|nr:hypothetical protein Mesci_4078 [Mesorhizobium ciceri biovar biserrulae WSM1271]